MLLSGALEIAWRFNAAHKFISTAIISNSITMRFCDFAQGTYR